MADLKISELTNLTAADPANDMIPIVDVSATPPASGSTKRISINNILACSPTATLASATITGDLTVRTNKLAVTSTGVGIGTTTPTAGILLDVVGGTFARFNKGAANQYHLRIGNSAKDYGLYVDIDNNGTNGFALYDITAGADTLRYVPGVGGSWTYYINGVQALAINSNAALILKGGSASASGVGIAFPATQVASSDANTLDDYEEGTFTPAIIGTTTTGAGTYVDQSGIYTKVGRQVTIQIFLNWTAHTGTGNMRLAGLPFTSSNSFQSASVGYWNNIAVNASSTPMAYVVPSATTIELLQMPSGGGAMGPIPMDVSGGLMISATYFV